MKITGAGTCGGKTVDFDASVTILKNMAVFGIAGLFILDATVNCMTINEVDASTRRSRYQPLLHDSTPFNLSFILEASKKIVMHFYATLAETPLE